MPTGFSSHGNGGNRLPSGIEAPTGSLARARGSRQRGAPADHSVENWGSKSNTGLTKTLKLAETRIENSRKHGGGGHYVIPLRRSSLLLLAAARQPVDWLAVCSSHSNGPIESTESLLPKQYLSREGRAANWTASRFGAPMGRDRFQIGEARVDGKNGRRRVCYRVNRNSPRPPGEQRFMSIRDRRSWRPPPRSGRGRWTGRRCITFRVPQRRCTGRFLSPELSYRRASCVGISWSVS